MEKIAYSILIVLSIYFKTISGYEYISSIMLCALMPFLLAPLQQANKLNYGKYFRSLIYLSAILLMGFILALAHHANMKGDGSILEGLGNIYSQDYLRRTHGDSASFDPVYSQSLNASLIDVFYKYVFGWNSNVIIFLRGGVFPYITIVAFLYVALGMALKVKNAVFNFAYLTFSFLMPLSWYLLAKAHSHAHGHINFVLWSFFLPALLYVYITALNNVGIYILKKMN